MGAFTQNSARIRHWSLRSKVDSIKFYVSEHRDLLSKCTALPRSASWAVLSVETCSLCGTQSNRIFHDLLLSSAKGETAVCKRYLGQPGKAWERRACHTYTTPTRHFGVSLCRQLIRFRQIHNEMLLSLTVPFDMIWPKIKYIVYISWKGKTKNFSIIPRGPHFQLGEGKQENYTL